MIIPLFLLLLLSTQCREPGDLSKAGILKRKNPFFSIKYHENDAKHIKRRLLNEDESLDGERNINFKEAITMLADFLDHKAEKSLGERALQKRVAREYLKAYDIADDQDVKAKILYDAMSSKNILMFANKWVLKMYEEILKDLSMLREGMSVEEILNEAETFGLGFHTWRMMRNEEKHWDEDQFDQKLERRTLQDSESDEDDWVQKMELDMEKLKAEQKRSFSEFDKQFNQRDNQKWNRNIESDE